MSVFDVARLAAQLARTSAARHMTVDEIATAAHRIISEAQSARRAAEKKKPIANHVARLRLEVQPFGAQVLPAGDVAGMVIGLKFDDGSYRNGAGNVFHVA